MQITRINSIKGELSVPGDKSISHRAVMIGSLAEGKTQIEHFLFGADCLSTINCFRSMGVEISIQNDSVTIYGKGMRRLKQPEKTLDAGNSGTTTRLICGILAPQDFSCMLDGDDSIRKRPMNRVITPLAQMGADITSINHNGCAPLAIAGKPLRGISYHSQIASAQVKSSILLAGLYADDKTAVTEPYLSRNHTELMLSYFGAEIQTEGTRATVFPCQKLTACKVEVPGDISSASYFMAAALILPNSEILIKNVGINPTRDGIISIIKNMGGKIGIHNKRMLGCEEVADISIESSSLRGITIGGSIIPKIIDEIPIIAVMAAYADGQTIIKDAQELRVKESNRIDTVVNNLAKMGVEVTSTEDGMIINGGRPLKGAVIDSHSDHRIAMSFSIAGLDADGATKISGSECIGISYPGFYQDLSSLYAR